MPEIQQFSANTICRGPGIIHGLHNACTVFTVIAIALLHIPASLAAADTDADGFRQGENALLAGEHIGVAYSGFRLGQHPDRGEGAANPSEAEVLEDLMLLDAHGFKLIRLYDSRENSAATLRLIRQHDLAIKVLLGIWLDAELSNHEGCAWLDEPIPDEELAQNKLKNAAEIDSGIALATEYPEIVIAVNVGNEALADWNDHMVSVDAVIAYVQQVKQRIRQPVTVADNYEWWRQHGAALAAVVDFIGLHTYPLWENKTIDEALSYTIENIITVHAALPNRPIAVLEGGWVSTASEFIDQANEANQARYYREISQWAKSSNTTFMFFEAFDEPWKGDPQNALGAEKHWGLFYEDRTPKQVMQMGD
jgi:exo-beta-1,3-glucanase (GH17 family)